MAVGINAQSSWKGFLGPLKVAVKEKQLSVKSDVVKPVVIVRPAFSATGALVEFESGTPVTTPISGYAVGVSWGAYTSDASGKPYCKYAVNASLWTNLLLKDPVNTKMGVSVTGEVLNRLINVGPLVYFNSGKLKVGIAFNLSYPF